MGRYHISDMIPVALPPHVAGAGLTRSLLLVPRTLDSTVHCVSSLTSINAVMYSYAGQASLVDRSSCNRHIEAEFTLLLLLEGLNPRLYCLTLINVNFFFLIVNYNCNFVVYKLPEPASSDYLITKHYISLNTFFFIYCVLGCVLNKIFIFF